MANIWGGRIINLDTLSTDNSYVANHDVKNASSNVQYSSLAYKIKKIQVVGGTNGENVRLTECSPLAVMGNDIVNVTLETGDLRKQIDFDEGQWFYGINPKSLPANGKVLINIA